MTGEELLKFRREYGITQAGLARRAGVAEITVRRFETGKRRPRQATVALIFDALDGIINDALVHWAKQQQCGCGNVGLRISYRFSARPVGMFSHVYSSASDTLSIAFDATDLPWLACPSCDAEAQGRFERD